MTWEKAVIDCAVLPEGSKAALTFVRSGSSWEATVDPNRLFGNSGGTFGKLGMVVLWDSANKVVASFVDMTEIKQGASGVGTLHDGSSISWSIGQIA